MGKLSRLDDARIVRDFQRRWGFLGLVHPNHAKRVIADDFAEGRLDSHGVYVMRNSLIGPMRLPIVSCAECNPPLDFSRPLFSVDR